MNVKVGGPHGGWLRLSWMITSNPSPSGQRWTSDMLLIDKVPTDVPFLHQLFCAFKSSDHRCNVSRCTANASGCTAVLTQKVDIWIWTTANLPFGNITIKQHGEHLNEHQQSQMCRCMKRCNNVVFKTCEMYLLCWMKSSGWLLKNENHRIS